MKNFNFFHSKEEHGRGGVDSGSEWDDVANYGKFEDQEPSVATEEQIVQGAEKAERNAERYSDASEIGKDYARSIIEQIKSGKMTREEGKAIYEKLKREEDQYQQELKSDIEEQMQTEKQYEADRRKNLLEKINNHPVARKVVSGILAAGIVAGGFAISKRIMGSKGGGIFSTTAYAEDYGDGNSSIGDIEDNAGDEQQNSIENNEAEETVDDTGESASDEFETMANGVTYSKDAYSNERRDKKYDFTNEFQDVYGDEMGTKEAIINAVTKDPIYLVAVFGKLPDEMKGNYAGMSDTVLANAINGVAGAEVQEFMIDAVKNAVETGDVDFVTSAGGEIAHIEYEIRDKGEESNPSNVRLAYREATILEGDKSTRLTLSDGSEVVFDDTCGNVWILTQSSSMEQDGHVEIVEDDEDSIPEDPTPEDPTPEDPTPEDPTPEDPTPEDPTPEDPTPEDPTPEDPTPEDPTPEDPTPEDPTPEDPTPEDPTPEDPTPEDPTPEDPTPEDPTPEDPTPEDIAPKDKENLERIDEQIKEDIENDIGTDELVINPTEDVVKEEGEATDAPIDIEDGTGTEHRDFEQNEDSKEAEEVDHDQVKEDGNEYSENKGGAHDNEYAPVKDDHEAQAEADKRAGLENNNGGMTREELENLYDELFDNEDGDNNENEGGSSQQNHDKEEDTGGMSDEQLYNEIVAKENQEAARDMTDDEFEDILSDLGL